MFKFKKITILLLVLILSINVAGCKGKNDKADEEKKKISIYVDVKDKYSLNIIKFLIDNYKNEEENTEVDIINPLNSQRLEEDIAKGAAGDIIITSRNTMIGLSRKGLLSDLGNTYSRNKINEKYYNIVTSYGRVGDKYFGIGMMPFTIEVFFNKDNLKKLGLDAPKSITDLVSILKKMTESNLKVPVLLTEDIDIYNGLASIIFCNTSDLNKLEEKYNSGFDEYKKLNEMQRLFNDVYYLSKIGALNKETFEMINENSLNRLIGGDTPILIGNSYIVKDLKEELKNEKIGIIESYNISPVKENIPVIINSIVCMPTNVKNEEAANSFIEFMFSEKAQKKLVEEGFITGNKEANGSKEPSEVEKKEQSVKEKTEKEEKDKDSGGKKEEKKDKEGESSKEPDKMEGVKEIIDSHLKQANNNSIIYVYNLPKEFQSLLETRLNRVLSGKYTSTEWEEILKEIYKK